MSVRSKNIMKLVLVAIYLLLTMAGLVFMKLGGNPGTFSLKNGNMMFGMSLVSLLGFICYISSFLLFTRIVVIYDLSYIMPICTGIIQVLVLVASYMIFKEQISKQGLIGAILVIAGIVIMNLKTKS